MKVISKSLYMGDEDMSPPRCRGQMRWNLSTDGPLSVRSINGKEMEVFPEKR